MLLNLPVLSPLAVGGSDPQADDRSSDPRNPHVHLFDTEHGSHLLVVNGSRVYGLDDEWAERFRAGIGDAGIIEKLLASAGVTESPLIDDTTPHPLPMRALSLAVAQKCNLACTYCYAQEGDFGGEAKAMSREVAFAAIDRLFEQCVGGERVNLAFLGGEPLLGREVLRAATEYAAGRAQKHHVRIGFSITSNGTLVTAEDGAFFEQYGFAVTISLDGVEDTHDRLRAYKGGAGSFSRILNNVRPLLTMQRRMQVSARVTVTPRNLELSRTLDTLVGTGFHSVGFSPMLSSPTGRDQMSLQDLDGMLEQMTTCGRDFERRVILGERYPFANMVTAMREIHRGTHRPYPCGAGAGYFGVSADGELSACHRFVGDPKGAMGNLNTGVDRDRQTQWLTDRHVHRQEPCRSCWARYLCGGGCHHEVIARGRPACKYIRGWLHYCLQAYVRLLAKSPSYFEAAP
jgi:uncharacterized protein